ncbi:aspartic peptidase domain-containing protein [Chytridium lagenaria]|nr:aspartic peptidase domain-containing protein [Chytridium lagenaria]
MLPLTMLNSLSLLLLLTITITTTLLPHSSHATPAFHFHHHTPAATTTTDTTNDNLIRIPIQRRTFSSSLKTDSISEGNHDTTINVEQERFNRVAFSSGGLEEESGDPVNVRMDSGSDDGGDALRKGVGYLKNLRDNTYNYDSCNGHRATLDSLKSTGIPFATHYGQGFVRGKVYIGDVSIGSAKARELLEADGDTDGILGQTRKEIGRRKSVGAAEVKNDGDAGKESGEGSNKLRYGTVRLDGQHRPYRIQPFQLFRCPPSPIDKNMFGFYLSYYRDGDHGEVVFGGYDPHRIVGNVTWLKVNSPSYWQFDMRGFTYDVWEKPLWTDGVVNGISDTGTTLVLLHPKVGGCFGGRDGESGRLWGVDCGMMEREEPVVRIRTGEGETFELMPKDCELF